MAVAAIAPKADSSSPNKSHHDLAGI
jgi:hypothetical protein